MSANFERVIGFYVPIGGHDYPKSWGPNTPFGFDPNQIPDPVTGKLEPVYGSSLSDVVNVFKEPITTTKLFSIDNPSGLVSSLTIQKPSEDFDTTSLSLNSGIWASVFKIIEYIYVNQDVTDLYTKFHNDVIALLAVNPLPYQMNSISFNKTQTHPNRVEYFTFIMNFGNAGDDVTFKIYLNPDSLIKNESEDRYQVYLYEDTNNDNLISHDEWRTRIVEKHLSIFDIAHYKDYTSKTTRYRYKDGNGVEFWTEHLFIVYLITNNFTTEMTISAIKEFLLSTVRPHLGRPYTYQECVYHYPDLFSERIVNIFPINNLSNQSKFMSPVTISMIHDTLVSNNLDDGDENFNNSEIIYIGNETTNVSNDLNFPLVCASNKENDTIRPIGDTFPEYAPLYKSFPTDWSHATQTEIFHHLTYIGVAVLMNKILPTSTTVTSIPSSYNFIVGIVDSAVSYIKFSLLATEFIVHKMR